ncbi:hypothetical protein [Janibacter sp. Soil728]|uniref:hypothetical protein n=1 Tax=Janibacter sp. Soil728 TaxID=1736393 RepID=UPI000B202214|nr:hypothetical protein [Janibacter sp. Soil728]
MDPVRAMIHLGLKVTETTLDRALDVVRLADTLLAATAEQPLRERDTDAAAWPDEEQADLDALSATLRARGGGPSLRGEPVTTSAARPVTRTVKRTTATASPVKSTAKKTTAKKRPAKKASAAAGTTSPAKKTAKKTTKAAAKKTAKRTPSTIAPKTPPPSREARADG